MGSSLRDWSGGLWTTYRALVVSLFRGRAQAAILAQCFHPPGGCMPKYRQSTRKVRLNQFVGLGEPKQQRTSSSKRMGSVGFR